MKHPLDMILTSCFIRSYPNLYDTISSPNHEGEYPWKLVNVIGSCICLISFYWLVALFTLSFQIEVFRFITLHWRSTFVIPVISSLFLLESSRILSQDLSTGGIKWCWLRLISNIWCIAVLKPINILGDISQCFQLIYIYRLVKLKYFLIHILRNKDIKNIFISVFRIVT